MVGDIDANDPVRKLEWFQPFADHLGARLGRFGIELGEVRIAPDIETMVGWLRGGEVDAYLDSLYPAMVVCERSGAVPVLRRWKGGVPEYHTVFLTGSESGIETLEELNGRVLGLDDEASTSGFFLPIAFLRARGLELVRLESPADAVPPDRIGYVLTGDDENAIQWLLSRRVAAAAIDSITLERHVSPATRRRLRLLAETDPVPRQVLVVRRGLDPALRDGLLEELLGLHRTAAGRAALASIDTDRFDRFPQGPEAALRQLEQAYGAGRVGVTP